MKFVTVRDLRTSPAKVWKTLEKEQEMVITNNGKPIALLTPISDESFEATVKAMRKARAENAIRDIQLESVKKGLDRMTAEEISDEIARTRKERAR